MGFMISRYTSPGSVTPDTSLFNYHQNNFNDYNLPDFVPMFADELPSDVLAKGDEICGDNQACLFDFAATHNKALAKGTRVVDIDADAVRAVMRKL